MLARELGRILNLEVIHLDALYWRSGWIKTPKPEWRQAIATLIQRDSWIMDGNYGGTMDLHLSAADTVIFLDFSNVLCLWRVIRRWWQYSGKTRPDMGSGCPEKLDWEFLQWIWNYPTVNRPLILDKLRQLAPDQQVVILRSPTAVEQFLQQLSPVQPPCQNS